MLKQGIDILLQISTEVEKTGNQKAKEGKKQLDQVSSNFNKYMYLETAVKLSESNFMYT